MSVGLGFFLFIYYFQHLVTLQLKCASTKVGFCCRCLEMRWQQILRFMAQPVTRDRAEVLRFEPRHWCDCQRIRQLWKCKNGLNWSNNEFKWPFSDLSADPLRSHFARIVVKVSQPGNLLGCRIFYHIYFWRNPAYPVYPVSCIVKHTACKRMWYPIPQLGCW